VIPRFLRALLDGQRPVIFGDGKQTRDFTYVANVVQANLLAAEAPDAVGQAINIGCGERVSLNQVLAVAGALLGVRVEAEYREPRAGDVRDSLADIALARRLLGYEPAVAFGEGLARTLDALRSGDGVRATESMSTGAERCCSS
jgi:UDP-glucose 4-epimerase